MSTWANKLDDEHTRPFFYLVIGGIPVVFGAGTSPGWAAPTCARHGAAIPAYTQIWDCLQIAGGIGALSYRIDERAGIVGPSAWSVQVQDRSGVLRRLFATELTSADRTILAGVVDHTDVTADCYDLTGWPAAGVAYCGPETWYYDPIAANQMQGLLRGCYAWRYGAAAEDRWNLDHRHWHEGAQQFYPADVATNPTSWEGRRAVLCANFRWSDGDEPLDAAFRGTHEWEVTAGYIQSVEPEDETGVLWTIRVEPYTARLKQPVGQRAAKATVGLPPSQYPIVHVPEGGYVGRFRAQWYEAATQHDKTDLFVLKNPATAATVRDVWMRLDEWWYYWTWSLRWHIVNVLGWATWPALDYYRVELISGVRARLEMRWAAAAANEAVALLSLGAEIFDPAAPSAIDGGIRIEGQDLWAWNDTGGITLQLVINRPAIDGAYLSSTSQLLPLVLDGITDAAGRSFSAVPTAGARDGYVVASDGEVIRYDGIVATGISAGYTALTVSDRGALGTEARARDLEEGSRRTDVEVTDAVGFDRESAWSAIRWMLVSTGEAVHGAHDLLRPAWGLGLDPSTLDPDSWDRIVADCGATAHRTLAISDDFDVGDWLEAECVAHQVIACQRTCADGQVRVGLYRIGDPSLSYISDTMTAIRAKREPGRTKAVTGIRLACGWDAAEAKHRGSTLTLVDLQADIRSGANIIDLKLPGLTWSPATAFGGGQGPAVDLARRIIARWGKRQITAEGHAGLEALLLEPGQTVLATVSTPTDEGDVGYTARPAVVLGVDYSPFDPRRDSQATVWLLLGRDRRATTYAPVARVTAYAGGPPGVLTLSDNEFCLSGTAGPWGESPAYDWHWFREGAAAGFGLWVWHRGDWAGGEAAQIATYNADGTVDLVAPLAAIVPGAATLVTFLPYDNAATQPEQQIFAYVADDLAPPTLGAAGDPAMRWS